MTGENVVFTAVAAYAALALVFAWAAISKLRQPMPAAEAAVAFGVTRRATRGRGLMLGFAESTVAAGFGLAVLVPSVRLVVATVGTAVLLMFCALILRALRQDRTFQCACFGQEAALDAKTLRRTLALTALGATGMVGAIDQAALSADETVAAAVFGAALLATVVLAPTVNDLRRLNDDPFNRRPEKWIRRLPANT